MSATTIVGAVRASRLGIPTAAEAAASEASRTKEQERRDANRERDKVTYVVVVTAWLGLAVGLMALTVILTIRIIVPHKPAARDVVSCVQLALFPCLHHMRDLRLLRRTPVAPFSCLAFSLYFRATCCIPMRRRPRSPSPQPSYIVLSCTAVRPQPVPHPSVL